MNGFTFWERGALNQFAHQSLKVFQNITELTDNNNPASVMHDDPRKALEQVHVMALGLTVEAKREIKEERPCYVVKWRGLNDCECLEVFSDHGSAHAFLDHLRVRGGIVFSQLMRGPDYVRELREA